MATTTDTPVSTQIYKSRDRIRNEIISKMKEYLELENVDLTKSSFLSFMIEILSTNTSNLLFYQMSTYREFFLTKAQLPESIYNLSAFLGYTPKDATPAEVNILFNIPFGFSDSIAQFTLEEGFKLKAEGGIEFATYYNTTIKITNNSEVSVIVREGNRTYIMPVTYEADQFLFVLPFRQYSTSIQEFQVSQDLKQYQFTSFDVPFEGQISNQIVEVRPPDSISYELYSQVSSLFLMDSSTKGYVSRRTDSGISIQFGNGLIGFQPDAGSTVKVTLSLTNGSDGNVISGSIHANDRIYITTLSGITQVVEYTVTNTSPAFNGVDEESLEAVRRNAITNLTALERIITKNDFVNANIIIDDSPIGQNSLPVLKRSDIKINEIALFSTLLFNSELVPTRDIYADFTDLYIPRKTILTQSGIEYYTLFDMEIDPLNISASYSYIMYEIEQLPSLVTSYGSDYNLYASNLIVKRDGLQATYELQFTSTEPDVLLSSCQMEISETGAIYNMTTDSTSFIYIFSDNRIIPSGDLTYFFTLQHSIKGMIGQYTNKFIFKLSLEDFTISNTLMDGTTFTVYDIPTISKDYYDDVNQRDFETQALQKLLTTMTFKDYRMLTDFINFKFSNTTGSLNNMQLNDVDLLPAQSILTTPPPITMIGERYVVNKGVGDWINHDNDIATSSIDGTSYIWVYTKPKSDQIIYISNEGIKYIYSEFGWIVPTYNIPLQLSLDVFVNSTYTGTVGDLTQSIRDALILAFESRFGINSNIYRSEIIRVVQEVEGVSHCNLIQPSSSIFFNFDIDTFTQQQLLEYAPEYVYFTSNDISIRVF